MAKDPSGFTGLEYALAVVTVDVLSFRNGWSSVRSARKLASGSTAPPSRLYLPFIEKESIVRRRLSISESTIRITVYATKDGPAAGPAVPPGCPRGGRTVATTPYKPGTTLPHSKFPVAAS